MIATPSPWPSQQTHKQRPAKSVTKHPGHAQTLMRSAVHKPSRSLREIASLSSPLDRGSNLAKITTPVAAGKINTELAERAAAIQPSPKISRFGAEVKSKSTNNSYSYSGKSQPYEPSKHQPAKEPTHTLLDTAIYNSESHKQPKLSKKELRSLYGKERSRSRTTAFLTVALMGLLVIGYAVYANMPNIMAKVASVRAGFSTVLPSYRPAGYSLESVAYEPGAVSFNFKSNSNPFSSFSLAEHSSNWNSATLVSNLVVPITGSNYHKVTLNGQSVYLLGKDKAAWVHNGILFEASGNGSLSTNQLLKLATTL